MDRPALCTTWMPTNTSMERPEWLTFYREMVTSGPPGSPTLRQAFQNLAEALRSLSPFPPSLRR